MIYPFTLYFLIFHFLKCCYRTNPLHKACLQCLWPLSINLSTHLPTIQKNSPSLFLRKTLAILLFVSGICFSFLPFFLFYSMSFSSHNPVKFSFMKLTSKDWVLGFFHYLFLIYWVLCYFLGSLCLNRNSMSSFYLGLEPSEIPKVFSCWCIPIWQHVILLHYLN